MCIWGGGNAVSSEMGGILTTFDANRLSRCVTETCDQVLDLQQITSCLFCLRDTF
jgi:hypothetical protein